MPKSTFYACLKTLEVAEFIDIDWLNSANGEFDIIILDNMFVKENTYNEGYLKLDLDFILSHTFVKLHVNLKKLILRLLGLQAGTRRIKVYDETLKKYRVFSMFESLKTIFNITYCKDGSYWFTLKEELKKKTYSNMDFLQYKHKLISYCRNHKIAYTMNDLEDSAEQIMIHIKKKASKIQIALDYIRELHLLQPKLINSICTNF
jgi:hypothetical protein